MRTRVSPMNRKDRALCVKFTNDSYNALRDYAEAHDYTMSQLVRHKVNEIITNGHNIVTLAKKDN